MEAKVSYLIYKIRTSFWFMPTVITLAAIALSQVVLAVDREVPEIWFNGLGGLFEIGSEGSRLLLSTIAGSMMTVTSLVFSLTLIALTMTSSQFGPRLLTSFMQDRVTQIVLGTFLATFVYSLITLGSIHRANADDIVPHLSVSVAMVLAIGSFGVLIYFIHHIATAIQADSIISKVTGELNAAIEEQFPPAAEDGDGTTPPDAEEPDFESDVAAVPGPHSGYIQAVDHDCLVALAADNGLVIRIERRAGHFVVPGEPIARVIPADRTNPDILEAVAGAYVVGRMHTMVQDLEYAVNAIVEIALRALSPGINDTYTALACIDNISATLANALKRRPPARTLRDGERKVRVVLSPVTFDGLLDSAFNEIRQCAGGNVSVVIRIAEALIRIAPFAKTEDQRAAIAKHAEMLDRAYEDRVSEPNDRADIERRLETLSKRLESAS